MSFSPYDEPSVPSASAPAPQPKSTQAFILGLLIVGIVGVLVLNQVGLLDFNNSDQVVIENIEPVEPVAPIDDKEVEPQQDGVSLKECVLLVIRDKSAINQDTGYAETMLDDEFWRTNVQGKLKDIEVISPNDDVAVSFLEQNKLTPPVIVLLDTRSKPSKVLWDMPLPKGGTDPIKERLFK